MVCYLRRQGRAVSPPGHIAEGGDGASFLPETVDKEEQNNEVSLSF